MNLLLVALSWSSPADACSMVYLPPDLGLPGATAGPEAVFTAEAGATLIGPDGEVAVTRFAWLAGSPEAEVLVPLAPLAPGEYHVSSCSPVTGCTTTMIVDGAGDPGVFPAPPGITLEGTRVYSGRQANCGPQVAATVVTATTDALAVVFAEQPADTLEAADVIGFAHPDEDGTLTWTTTEDVAVFAASVDAEGELSEWSGPHDVARGCSTTSADPRGLGVLAAAVVLARLRKSRPA